MHWNPFILSENCDVILFSVLGTVVMQGLRVVFNRSDKTVGFMKAGCGPLVNMYGPTTVGEGSFVLPLATNC